VNKAAAVVCAVLAVLGGFILVLFVGTGLSRPAPAGVCTPGTALAVGDDLPDGEIAGYSGEQLANAATIMRVGAERGMDAWGQTIGVMTAMGESGLRILDRGDAAGPDSRGLFQQRDNGAWGTYADRMDPARSAAMFFDALNKLESWRDLQPTLAANRVQRNADPLHYTDYWDAAVQVVTALSEAATTDDRAPGHRYDLGPVKPHTQTLAEEVGARFDLAEIGGYRESAVDAGGHPAGLAVDFMTHDDAATGDAIVSYLVEHADRLSVDYIFWRQAIWRAAEADKGWQPMADRGSDTANHLDHPHVNVTPTPSANAGTGPLDCLTATTAGPAGTAAGQWAAPVDGPITSRYGPRLLFGSSFHAGTDFGAACGTPIYAAADGRVTYAGGPHPGLGLTGNVIVLDHGDGIQTSYNHMYASGLLVRSGQRVTAGQLIAVVGNDGNSTNCHLHFAVYVNGEHTDPESFMSDRAAYLS